jgi:hypothetical protein
MDLQTSAREARKDYINEKMLILLENINNTLNSIYKEIKLEPTADVKTYVDVETYLGGNK